MKITKENVKDISKIYIDMWKVYKKLQNLWYYHKIVNHGKEFIKMLNDVSTNKIECNWSTFKNMYMLFIKKIFLTYSFTVWIEKNI